MAKYEKNVYIAMLAEQCSRFEEMIEYLEDMIGKRQTDLTTDERNLISIAYKNSVSNRRTAIRTIMAYETKEKKKENSNFLPSIQEYKKKVEEELVNCCKKVLASIDKYLIGRADDYEAKVFYLKMKGDYNRYIAESTQNDIRDNSANDALNSYKEASGYAKNLSTINPIALGLALNFSVFYYEVMNDQETACKIAKDTLDNANKELPNIDEDDENQRDALSIINLLRENLEMWKIEADQ